MIHETRGDIPMIRTLLLSVMALIAAPAIAADTDPLDFDYQVVARAADRARPSGLAAGNS